MPPLIASHLIKSSYLHSHSHNLLPPFHSLESFEKMKKMSRMANKPTTTTTAAAAATTTSDAAAFPNLKNPKVDVRALCFSLHNAKSADDVDELLKVHPPHLPLPVFTSIIKHLGMDDRLDAAFAVVEWLNNKNEENLTLTIFIYNCLLNAVRLTKQFHRVAHVLHHINSHGFQPNIVTYNTLMSIYIDQGNPQEVFHLFSQIHLAGLSPSPATYSTVLSAYKHIQDSDGALQFFVEFREKYRMGELSGKHWDKEFVKIQYLTVEICQSLMRIKLVKEENKNTTEVLRFLTCMDRADIKLNRHFFERLVWACTREEHYPMVRELYKRLRESGPGDDISVSVCNHIMWLMGKAKKWWAALEVYEEMIEAGPMPNDLSFELVASNFTVLMTAAGRRGLWRWALMLLDKMHQKGLTPGSREWNAVLIACSKAGETDAAVNIFQKMVQEGEKPTVHSYGALLSAFGKGKLYDEAIRVWEHMQKVGVKPNLHLYTILASIYAQKGDHDAVEAVLQEMVAARIEPTVVTFNAIISSCVKGQMGAAAFEWFHKMKGRNVKPNEVSYEMVIGALAHDGKPRLAYQMYVRAYNEGLVLNKKAYDAVVEADRVGSVSVELDALGFYPVERRKPTKIKNKQSDFCGRPQASMN